MHSDIAASATKFGHRIGVLSKFSTGMYATEHIQSQAIASPHHYHTTLWGRAPARMQDIQNTTMYELSSIRLTREGLHSKSV